LRPAEAVPYAYLEDDVTSDVTFRAWGADLGETFLAAADATLNLMVSPLDAVATSAVVRSVELEAATLDLLLVALLDELIFAKDAEGLLLRVGPVWIVEAATPCRLRAELGGEPLDRGRHALGVDVKAVTLYGLSVERRDGGWEARVTVDV
jgi:SHS2 domain-containing protein